MAEQKWLELSKKGPVATITFNRPEKRNAIAWSMWRTLCTMLKDLEQDSTVKVLVIRSSDPKAFSSGADIGEFQSVRDSAEAAKTYNDMAHEVETALAHLPMPTIAMIRGYCIGAGCELSLVCDFRFADTSAVFAITPARMGMVYNLFGVKYLVHLIGAANAKDMLYSARKISAEEAFRIGLINRVYEPDNLESEVYQYALQLSENSAVSIRGAKRLIHEVLHGVTEENEEIQQLILASFDSPDYKEGVEAFLRKRKPRF